MTLEEYHKYINFNIHIINGLTFFEAEKQDDVLSFDDLVEIHDISITLEALKNRGITNDIHKYDF